MLVPTRIQNQNLSYGLTQSSSYYFNTPMAVFLFVVSSFDRNKKKPRPGRARLLLSGEIKRTALELYNCAARNRVQVFEIDIGQISGNVVPNGRIGFVMSPE